MFILGKKLYKTNNLILAIKPVYSFGLYRWKLLNTLFWYHNKNVKNFFINSSLIYLKFYLIEILGSMEMDQNFIISQIDLKKAVETYQGLRLHLNLPVNGQRTRTNASTQRLLAKIPRKRHFLQRKNWWKFAPKDHKKNFQKLKNNETDKK